MGFFLAWDASLAPLRHVMWVPWWETWPVSLVLFISQLGILHENNLRLTFFFCYYCLFCCISNTMSDTSYPLNENVKTLLSVCVCACVCLCVKFALPQWEEVIEWTVSSQGFLQSLCIRLNEETFSLTKRHDATKDWTLKRSKSEGLPSPIHSYVQGLGSQTQGKLSSKIPTLANTGPRTVREEELLFPSAALSSSGGAFMCLIPSIHVE